MAIVGTVDGKANLASEQVFGNRVRPVRPMSAVMQRLRELFPEKTAANIAVRARVSTRSAEYWLADDRCMSAEAFINLLIREEGHQILASIMAAIPPRDRPRWWQWHVRTVRMAALEHTIAAAVEEQKQLRLDMPQK